MTDVFTKVDTDGFLMLVHKCGLVEPSACRWVVASMKDALTGKVSDDPVKVAAAFVHEGQLTQWQADKLLCGIHKVFWLGSYRLLKHLGTGGMGSVYLAEHTLLRRQVAIKVLTHNKVADSSCVVWFRREAEAVARLDHPNIVRAYDIAYTGKTHYFVMEYVDGSSFVEIVRENNPLDCRRAADYIVQVARGLRHAHDAGLVHRDIKPANCLVNRSDVVKIIDLGLVLLSEEDEPSLSLAHDDIVLGTADYLAPEQAHNSHDVDTRADIYSLGCTFYFLLTGHPPFPEGTVSERLIKHQREEPVSIRSDRPDVPQEVEAICHAMMIKSRQRRVQTCREVIDRLQNWLDGETGQGVERDNGSSPVSSHYHRSVLERLYTVAIQSPAGRG
jgi:eukaryotic-like serine/threonine-protein kinase